MLVLLNFPFETSRVQLSEASLQYVQDIVFSQKHYVQDIVFSQKH